MSNSAPDILLLAAGFGTRLGELTDNCPKPLIEVGGKTLLEWNLELIARSGFRRVLINLHYLPDQIRQFVAAGGNGEKWGLEITCVEEEVDILDTGGAIKNIAPLLQSEVLITINSDILLGADFSLENIYRQHTEHPQNPIATMVLREDPKAASYGEIAIDAEGRVCRFLNHRLNEQEPAQILMYLGVQCLSTRVLDYMPKEARVFSVTRDTYPRLIAAQEYINSCRYDGYWNDVGTPERLNQAREDFVKFFPVS